MLDARRRRPAIPAVLGEANYEGENNQPETPPTTDQTLRRQVLWSLASGAAGEFFGSDDWEFHDGWEGRLSTRAVGQVARLRALFSAMPWWRLVPDTANRLVTAGRGTELRADEPMDVLENDYVTAARTRTPPGRRLPADPAHHLGEPAGHGRRGPGGLDRPGHGRAPPRPHVGDLHHPGPQRRRRRGLAAGPELVSAA